MNEQTALAKMIAPGQLRPTKWLGGVIQICITRMCDLSCFGCTQGSNLRNKKSYMNPEQFEQAVKSLIGYPGVVGVFGGNPAISPYFEEICLILQKHIPFRQRGLWCNNPLGKGKIMRQTFNPSYSNLNVHLSKPAFDEFKRDWPESMPCGLHEDSRHSPPYVAMKDVIQDEGKIWELISGCDINHFWSAYIGLFRGELRAYFCEVAGSQASLHEDEPDYPDTGMDPNVLWDVEEHREHLFGGPQARWWQLGMYAFRNQVRKHCFDCGVPLRGKGTLAQSDDNLAVEQCSATHEGIYHPKRKEREVQVVTNLQQLGTGLIKNMTRYLQNSHLEKK